MLSRTALRSHRAASRVSRSGAKRNVRWESATSKATPDTAAGSGALTGGLAGGGAALLVVYAWYQLSGTKSAVKAAKQSKQYVDNTIDSLKVKFEENTPGTDEAIKTLRDAANKYAAFIPGARQYVDTAFQDLETVRKRHGPEVDNIVSEAYGELRDASKNGMNMQTAGQVYQILTKHMERLLGLAKDAAEDVLENHPQLKDKLGGSADQLKQLGDQIGPKAKKEIDDAWKQVNDMVQQGLQAGTAMQAYSLLQEKIQKLRQMGEEAFNQGLQQLKPILEKNPQVKKFVEDNKEALQQGNISETINKVKDAVSSGNTQDLQQYIDQIKDKAQSFSSSRISEWLEKVPQGSEILPQLQKLRKIAEQRGEDAEKLAKETISEIKQVLDRKTQEAEKLAEGAKDEAKK